MPGASGPAARPIMRRRVGLLRAGPKCRAGSHPLKGSGRKPLAALGAAARQDLEAAGGLQSRAEAVAAFADELAGLIGAFHWSELRSARWDRVRWPLPSPTRALARSSLISKTRRILRRMGEVNADDRAAPRLRPPPRREITPRSGPPRPGPRRVSRCRLRRLTPACAFLPSALCANNRVRVPVPAAGTRSETRCGHPPGRPVWPPPRETRTGVYAPSSGRRGVDRCSGLPPRGRAQANWGDERRHHGRAAVEL